MKNVIYFGYSVLLMIFIACTDKDAITLKNGVSLPTVTNLTLAKAADSTVELKWDIPANLPDEVEKPVGVVVEVREMRSVTSFISLASLTLANAATNFQYEVPNPEKTYHFTVKLVTKTKESDPRYSSRIYSLGQTVIYN